MSETFGSRLRRFALSVDIVDTPIFEKTWELVQQYIERQLNPTYWALLVPSEIDRKPGLQVHKCSQGDKPSFSLKTAQGSYTGLAAYAFVKRKSLWVLSPDGEPLAPERPIRDEWSKGKNLPPFDPPEDADIKTEILIPLREGRNAIGLLDLQISEHIESTTRAKKELERLAETLSVLLALSKANQEQHGHTEEAIRLHGDALKDGNWPLLTKPMIFVASSDKADDVVMGEILGLLDEFGEQLDVYDWRDSHTGGNISKEILEQVQRCQFGLCYFSEPTDDPPGRYRYQDNINVAFEAGMFQALTNLNVTDEPRGWIPIREKDSPPPPFDFAQQRMIIVKRSRQGQSLNHDKLRTDLSGRIRNLLG